jgi:hypothetical protein
LGTTFYFLEAPAAESEILGWFRTLPQPPTLYAHDWGYSLYFRHLGPLVNGADGKPDARRSPVVSLFPPRVVRGVLWTAGEVHFLAKSKEIPSFDAVSRSFRSWIKKFEVVFEQFPKPERSFNYYLEGMIQNIAPVVYALPSGREALDREQYFVSELDGRGDCSTLCQKLRLRGVNCE